MWSAALTIAVTSLNTLDSVLSNITRCGKAVPPHCLSSKSHYWSLLLSIVVGGWSQTEELMLDQRHHSEGFFQSQIEGASSFVDDIRPELWSWMCRISSPDWQTPAVHSLDLCVCVCVFVPVELSMNSQTFAFHRNFGIKLGFLKLNQVYFKLMWTGWTVK